MQHFTVNVHYEISELSTSVSKGGNATLTGSQWRLMSKDNKLPSSEKHKLPNEDRAESSEHLSGQERSVLL